jgi:hypothetical protein
MAYNTVATFPGRGVIWGNVAKLTYSAVPKNIQWGSSTQTGSASANVNLFGPQTEARTSGAVSIISTTQLGDTIQITGTIVNVNAAKSITEAGLFDAASPVSPTTTVTNSLAATTTLLTLGTSLAGNVGNYYAQLGTETVFVTGAAALSLTVSRGQLGSTAAAWAAGTPITMGGDGGTGAGTTPETVNINSMTALYGGNLFLHSDFASISLNINDSVSFTFSDTLT